MGSTFAGMVTVFCQKLSWWDLELLIAQFTDRLNFGAQMDILPLVQIPDMKNFQARALYNAGYHTVAALASATPEEVAMHLRNAAPFKSKKASGDEAAVAVSAGQRVEARTARMIVVGAQRILGAQMVFFYIYRFYVYCININPYFMHQRIKLGRCTNRRGC